MLALQPFRALPALDAAVNSICAAAPRAGAEPALSALAFFFVMTSYYIIRPVRDQLSGAVGSSSLPLFYAVVFATMLLLTPVFGWLMARFSRRRLLGWSYSFFIICQLAFVPAFMAQDRIGARVLGVVFFAWVSVFNLFVVSLFWSVMADLFSSGRARRVFSLIALGGMAGAIFGPSLTKVLLPWTGVPPVLLVSALVLAMALPLLLHLSARHEQARPGGEDGKPIGGSVWTGVRELWSRPFLRYMALLMLLGDGIGTLAYALLADYVKLHFVSNVARIAFYNDLDLVTNSLGVLLQLTLTRWLLVRFGPGWGLVLPSLVNMALLLMVMVAGHGNVAVLGMTVPLLAVMAATTRGFAYGMTKPASDALYTRVPRETRYKGKNFVETAVWRFGDLAVTSAISALRLLGVGVAGLALAGAGVAALATWVSTRAGWSRDLAPEEKRAG